MNNRFCIYIKDKEILEIIDKEINKSEYVERAIRFYEQNKDIVERLANIIIDFNINP